ncbi:MAG TPA: hypothetical protein VFI97_04210 [Arthrobacter sp.]|nr:hypothetical protein [Arthrobacter sp.]
MSGGFGGNGQWARTRTAAGRKGLLQERQMWAERERESHLRSREIRRKLLKSVRARVRRWLRR